MPRYDAQCTLCKWEGEVACSFSQRDAQRCPTTECAGELEFLIGSPAQTRFGFGFKPGIRLESGEVVTPGKRRPATSRHFGGGES